MLTKNKYKTQGTMKQKSQFNVCDEYAENYYIYLLMGLFLLYFSHYRWKRADNTGETYKRARHILVGTEPFPKPTALLSVPKRVESGGDRFSGYLYLSQNLTGMPLKHGSGFFRS